MTPDAAVTERLAQIQDSQAGLLETTLGSTETTLWAGLIGGVVAVTRLVETNYGDLVTDAFRDAGETFMETAGGEDADLPSLQWKMAAESVQESQTEHYGGRSDQCIPIFKYSVHEKSDTCCSLRGMERQERRLTVRTKRQVCCFREAIPAASCRYQDLLSYMIRMLKPDRG